MRGELRLQDPQPCAGVELRKQKREGRERQEGRGREPADGLEQVDGSGGALGLVETKRGALLESEDDRPESNQRCGCAARGMENRGWDASARKILN